MSTASQNLLDSASATATQAAAQTVDPAGQGAVNAPVKRAARPRRSPSAAPAADAPLLTEKAATKKATSRAAQAQADPTRSATQAEAARKTAARPAGATTSVVKKAWSAEPATAESAASRKRDKPVRDGFTMPKSEYAVLTSLKQRAAELTRPTKKSELLRAGVKALAALDDAGFLAALQGVPSIKTGRPAAQEGSTRKAKTGAKS